MDTRSRTMQLAMNEVVPDAQHEPVRLAEIALSDGPVVAWLSTADRDDAWDEFVATLPEGRHEQTSRWGRVKKQNDWRSLRLLFTKNETLVGGCQVLWKRMRYVGKIGYVIDAPLLGAHDSELLSFAVEQLKRQASVNGLRALLVQPAMDPPGISNSLRQASFLPNHLYRMITATTAIDLSPDEEAILGAMRSHRRRNLRRNARRAQDIELRFVEGGEDDLERFFDLMCETCRRKGVAPNPASLDSLRTMWRLYHPKGNLNLFFMEKDDEKLCTGLVTGFGDRAFIWKIGWNGAFSKYSPNDLLHWGCIKWAKAAGFRYFDFDGINPEIAEVILSSTSVSDEIMKSPAFYKIGYGGDLIYYPQAQVYFPNPLLRWSYMAYAKFMTVYRSRAWVPNWIGQKNKP